MTDVIPDKPHVPVAVKYLLPAPNSALEAFLMVANSASAQACATETACILAMDSNENTTTGIMPSFPHMQGAFSSGVAYSTKSMLLSAESAFQAQTSVCEALAAAEATANQQKAVLTERIAEVDQKIITLEKQATALRSAFTKATDDPSTQDAYASVEAKRLLTCLEDAYTQHEMSHKLHQNAIESESNIAYLHQQHEAAQLHLAELTELRRRAEEEWQRIVDLFHLDPDSAGSDLPLNSSMVSVSSRPTGTPEAVAEKPAAQAEPRRSSAWEIIWSYIKIILLAFFIAILLRTYIFDITQVQGSSMWPTLKDQDSLINAKITYLFNDPARGDIVVLEAPDSPGENYIKRVIGLPGDTLRIKDGQVFINDELLDEPYLNGLETIGEVNTVVPDDFYFVMGDNRSESRDSRVQAVGMISRDSILGTAVFRLLPFSEFGLLD